MSSIVLVSGEHIYRIPDRLAYYRGMCAGRRLHLYRFGYPDPNFASVRD